MPEGYRAEDLVLTDEALTRAAERTLKEQFALGSFDNPYRDPDHAEKVIADEKDWRNAYAVHVKSVVPLKNKGQVLPIKEEMGKGKKIYAECFLSDSEKGKKETEALRKALEEKRGLCLADQYEEADYAIFFVKPSSGEYFHATKGYLELDICEDKTVVDVDEEGRPADSTHQETTLAGTKRIKEMAQVIHKRGGKVIISVNFTLAWLLGNVEPYADGLLAGFDTYPDAILDIILGMESPSGKLPVTLPKNDQVIGVNAKGVCVSRNDVPGFDKDLYMPEQMKDENGKAYSYRDELGSYYEYGFGLSWS